MTLVFRTVRFFHEIALELFSRLLTTFVGVRALIIFDGKVLAVEQGRYLEIPGGGVKHSEDPREAVKREVYEETGLEVEAGEILDAASIGPGVELIYKCKLKDSEDLKLEGSWEGQPVWIPLEEVGEREWKRHEISELL